MLFQTLRIFCTFTLVLSELRMWVMSKMAVCHFFVLLWFHAFLICCWGISWMILRWFKLTLLLLALFLLLHHHHQNRWQYNCLSPLGVVFHGRFGSHSQVLESWVGNFSAGKFVVDGCNHHKCGGFLCSFFTEFDPPNAGKWYVLQLCLCFL